MMKNIVTLWWLFFTIFLCKEAKFTQSARIQDAQKLIDEGVQAQQLGDYDRAMKIYEEVLSSHPNSADAYHLTGLIFHVRGMHDEALSRIEKALQLSPQNTMMLTNYAVVLMEVGELGRAEQAFEKVLERRPGDPAALHALGLARDRAGRAAAAEAPLRRAVEVAAAAGDPAAGLRAAALLTEILAEQGRDAAAAELWGTAAAAAALAAAGGAEDWVACGAALHRAGRAPEAAAAYEQALALAPGHRTARLNRLAAWQAEGTADPGLVLEGYWELHAEDPSDPLVLNNLGNALLQAHDERGVAMLEQAIAVDQGHADHARLNLATYYAEEGLLEEARALYLRVAEGEGGPASAAGFLLRAATLLPPVMASRGAVEESRARFEQGLRSLLAALRAGTVAKDPRCPRALDRVPFYLVYHGRNDRPLLQLYAATLREACPNVLVTAPHLQAAGQPHHDPEQTGENQEGVARRRRGGEGRARVRVGFCSRFFGPHEPHGLLLEGVAAGLPRDRFEVEVFWVAGPRGGVAPSLAAAADRATRLPERLEEAAAALSAARLDVLVLADTMGEPVAHLLAHARLARVQCAFWGNPTTSGSPAVDYFVSADRMEAPGRTWLSQEEEPYEEQVVLLGGQGIWYARPEGDAPAPVPRAHFGLGDGDLVFLCAQSMFKLHPDYDAVLAAIIARSGPRAKLVFTEGRRAQWTAAVRARLLGAHPALAGRVHFVPRQPPGEGFLRLLQTADVVLHPFPFGGSRTSAEALRLGLPLVCLRAPYLRGRMAASFFDTMGLGHLVAGTPGGYVDLAVALGADARRRARFAASIQERSHLIWDDRETVREWARFLARAAGLAPEGLPPPPPPPGAAEAGPSEGLEPGGPLEGFVEQGHGDMEKKTTDPTFWGRINQQQYQFVHESSPEYSFFQDVFEHALSLYEQENVEDALHLSKTATLDFQTSADLLNLLALCYFKLGDFAEAASLFGQILHNSPTSIAAHNNLAVALQGNGEFEASFDVYMAGLALRAPQETPLSDEEGRQRALLLQTAADLRYEGAVAAAAAAAEEEGGGAEEGGAAAASAGAAAAAAALLAWGLGLAARPDGAAPGGSAAAAAAAAAAAGPAAQAACLLALLEGTGDPGGGEEEGGGGGGGGGGLGSGLPRRKVSQVEQDLKFAGKLEEFGDSFSFYDTVLKIHRHFTVPANSLVHYLHDLNFLIDPIQIYRHFVTDEVIEDEDKPYMLESGFELMTQYPNVAEKSKESQTKENQDFALQRNLMNGHIHRIHLFVEEPQNLKMFLNHHKIHQVLVTEKLTFRMALEYSNRYLQNKLCIVSNSDIFFDETLRYALLLQKMELDNDHQLLALTSWCHSNSSKDVAGAGLAEDVSAAAAFHPRVDSQDAWIFRSPVTQQERDMGSRWPPRKVAGGGPLGHRLQEGWSCCGCQVYQDLGIAVRNPSLLIKARQVQHRSPGCRRKSKQTNILLKSSLHEIADCERMGERILEDSYGVVQTRTSNTSNTNYHVQKHINLLFFDKDSRLNEMVQSKNNKLCFMKKLDHDKTLFLDIR